MKKKLLFTCILLVLCAAACGIRNAQESGKGSYYYWSIIKSPITGYCYEIAERGQDYRGYSGMHKVDCTYYTEVSK